jgi:TatA/E family protein of Tat protein translocase
MGNLGWTEILIILVIALIIFGPRKLPELGKSLGQSLAQFRRASEDFKRTWEEEVEAEKRKLDAPLPGVVESSSQTYGESYDGYDAFGSTTAEPAEGSSTESTPESQPAEDETKTV